MASLERDKNIKLVSSGVLSDTGENVPFKVDPVTNELLITVVSGPAPAILGEPVSKKDENGILAALAYDEAGDRPLSIRATDDGELIVTLV